MKSIGWMVCTGPDRSHIYAEKLLPMKREAMKMFEEIKSSGRPCAVYRHTWASDYSTDGTVTLVAAAHLSDAQH